MTTTVIHSIGTTGRDYSTIQAWEDAAPLSLPGSVLWTTQAGSTSSTIVLAAGESAVNDYYKGKPIWIYSRPTEKRLITAYNGTTKVATIGSLNGSSATWDNIPTVEDYQIDSVIWKGECYNDSEFDAEVGFSGTTTDAACYLWLTTAAGQSWLDNVGVATNALRYNVSNGVGWRITGAYKRLMSFGSPYPKLVLEKMQLYYDSTYSSGSYRPIALSALSEMRHCVFQSRRLSAGGGEVVAPSRGIIANCLFICNTAGVYANAGIDGEGEPGYSPKIIGCTVVRPSDLGGGGTGIMVYTFYPQVIDCAVFGFTTAFGGTIANYVSGSGYNASNAAEASIPGYGGTGHNQYGLTYTNQFGGDTDGSLSSAMDFRARSTGNLANNGTASSYFGSPPVDIALRSRSATAPTIGAWEYGTTTQNTTAGVTESAGTATDSLLVLQILRPALDGAKGNWTTETGGTTNLYASINEATLPDSDTTYIRSGDSPTNDAYEAKLSVGAVPGGLNGGVYSYTIAQSGGAIGAEVALYQGQPSNGGTLIVSWAHSLGTGDTTLTRWDRQLTTTQVEDIVDPTDVWVKFTAGTT